MLGKSPVFRYTLDPGLTNAVIDIGGSQFDVNVKELDSIIAHLSLLRTRMLPSNEICQELIHPDDRQRVIGTYKESVQNGAAYDSTHRLLMKSGRSEWIHETCYIENDAQGQLVRTIGTMQSIYSTMLLNGSINADENNFRSLFEAVSIPYYSVDEGGYIIDVNEAWLRLWPLHRDDVVGHFIGDFVIEISLLDTEKKFSDQHESTPQNCSIIEIVRSDGKNIQLNTINCIARDADGNFLHQHGIFIGINEQKPHEKLLLAKDFQYRDALVREVHHRIKNNLQGVTGILRNFLAHHPELNDPIINVISQVHSIAVIHGLQGRAALTKVRLCELTSAIATSIESLWQTPITVDIPSCWIPCLVAEAEAVPLALVLNELISNAVKHGDIKVGVNIRLRHEHQPHMVQVIITNPGQLPSDFEYPRKSSIGTGLQLIASLLPRKGVSLSWTQEGKTVITSFELAPPIINLEQ